MEGGHDKWEVITQEEKAVVNRKIKISGCGNISTKTEK